MTETASGPQGPTANPASMVGGDRQVRLSSPTSRDRESPNEILHDEVVAANAPHSHQNASPPAREIKELYGLLNGDEPDRLAVIEPGTALE